jgi:hypothetical protein
VNFLKKYPVIQRESEKENPFFLVLSLRYKKRTHAIRLKRATPTPDSQRPHAGSGQQKNGKL